jgi:hypothetical protein
VHSGTSRSCSSDTSSRGKLKQQVAFKRRKKQHTWRSHQSVPNLVTGSGPRCRYKKCPGLNIKKQSIRPLQTRYRCEECSIDKGIEFWLCNTVKADKVVNCHQKYHIEMRIKILGSYNERAGSATESAVDSELTEE